MGNFGNNREKMSLCTCSLTDHIVLTRVITENWQNNLKTAHMN